MGACAVGRALVVAVVLLLAVPGLVTLDHRAFVRPVVLSVDDLISVISLSQPGRLHVFDIGMIPNSCRYKAQSNSSRNRSPLDKSRMLDGWLVERVEPDEVNDDDWHGDSRLYSPLH